MAIVPPLFGRGKFKIFFMRTIIMLLALVSTLQLNAQEKMDAIGKSILERVIEKIDTIRASGSETKFYEFSSALSYFQSETLAKNLDESKTLRELEILSDLSQKVHYLKSKNVSIKEILTISREQLVLMRSRKLASLHLLEFLEKALLQNKEKGESRSKEMAIEYLPTFFSNILARSYVKESYVDLVEYKDSFKILKVMVIAKISKSDDLSLVYDSICHELKN